MKVSFVIPAHNEEVCLPTCLESVKRELEHTQYDAEIIVVDNASTDRTAEIAESFEGVRVVHEPKKGLSQARQAGFTASTGDLIANIDADTIVPKGWLNKVLKEFKKDPELLALSGPFFYHDLPLITNFFIQFYYSLGYGVYLINRFILGVSSLLQGGNFIIRRQALEQVNGFDVSFDFYGEDTDIAKRLHKIGKVKFTMRLRMHTSGRRLKKEGVITMAVKYPINYFWTILFGKPFTKSYKDIRASSTKKDKK